MKLIITSNKRGKLYNQHLNTINGIKFTSREIDVISCLLNNRGEKKIAQLLSISPRTISTHVHNIMLKVGCNSREHIIDFLERSDKLDLIKKYYLIILVRNIFEQHLLQIAQIIPPKEITFSVFHEGLSETEIKLLEEIKADLKLANLILKDVANHNSPIPSDFSVCTGHNDIDIDLNKNKNVIVLSNDEYINFTEEENYYFLIFELIKKVIKHASLEQITQEFEAEYKIVKNSWEGISANIAPNFKPVDLKRKSTFRYILISLSSIILCILIGWLAIEKFFIFDIPGKISCDLPLPNERILLKRLSILAKINEKLNKPGKEIQTIALVGPGGSGKTTIARQYARNQKTPLIWEVNAETPAAIIASFEQLAYALCNNEGERQELATISQVKDAIEKDKKLFIFLTQKIKNYPWLMVYNNVETFKDIQKYFPYDPKVWGHGKVIITTRDSNIATNNYIVSENVIPIRELSINERLELFDKVINNDEHYSGEQKLTNIEFLEKIPPFPLDISLAAYYLKEEHISYDTYLEYISKIEDDFASIHEIILNDLGNYTKTRYEIVTLSIEKIIENSEDFTDLLMFISLIDSEMIPKDLLVAYKDDIIVSKFMHELRKFSLIVENNSANNKSNPTFSIHRNTQQIILSFLENSTKLKKDAQQLDDMASILGQFIDKQLAAKNFTYLLHAEIFLNHSKLTNKTTIYELMFKLSECYLYMANYSKAKNFLEQILEVYQKHYGMDDIKTAMVLQRLGIIYRNIANYDKSMIALETAFSIYKKKYGDDHIETLYLATRLGSVYRNKGNYVKARDLLEKSTEALKKHYGANNIHTARSQAYLGSIYKNLGYHDKAKELLENAQKIYFEHSGTSFTEIAWISARLGIIYKISEEHEKAKDLFEESLAIYKTHYGENCIEVAWCLSHLSNIYINLGEYKKAKDIVQQSLKIYANYLPEDHVTFSWALLNLGKIYQGLGEYTKAQKLFQQVLNSYEKNYGVNHIKTAIVLNHLGEAYFLDGSFKISEEIINRALVIFKQNDHLETYVSLENLSDLYEKKSIAALKAGSVGESKSYKEKSINYLSQALDILKTKLSENSLHIARLEAKLNGL